jgi:hypothetical protein
VAVLRDPATTAGQGQIGAIQALAASFAVEVTPVNVRDSGEIEHAMAAFARTSRDGLIVTFVVLACISAPPRRRLLSSISGAVLSWFLPEGLDLQSSPCTESTGSITGVATQYPHLNGLGDFDGGRQWLAAVVESIAYEGLRIEAAK